MKKHPKRIMKGPGLSTPAMLRVIGRRPKTGLNAEELANVLESKVPRKPRDSRQFRRHISVMLNRSKQEGFVRHEAGQGSRYGRWYLTSKGRSKLEA